MPLGAPRLPSAAIDCHRLPSTAAGSAGRRPSTGQLAGAPPPAGGWRGEEIHGTGTAAQPQAEPVPPRRGGGGGKGAWGRPRTFVRRTRTSLGHLAAKLAASIGAHVVERARRTVTVLPPAPPSEQLVPRSRRAYGALASHRPLSGQWPPLPARSNFQQKSTDPVLQVKTGIGWLKNPRSLLNTLP